MHLIFFFAVIGSFIASSSAGIVFKSGPLQARGEISAASLWFKDQAVPAEVSGPFMFFDVQEMKNHVVAVSTSDIEFISHANTACSRGAIAIVIVNDARIVGDGCIQYLAEVTCDTPIVQLEDITSSLLKNSEGHNVTLINGSNSCHNLYNSLAYHILCALMAISTLILCAYCCIVLVKVMVFKSDRFLKAVVVITTCIIANIVRFVYSLDIEGGHAFYGYKIAHSLFIASIPIDAAANVLIIMFWHEVWANKKVSGKGSNFLSRNFGMVWGMFLGFQLAILVLTILALSFHISFQIVQVSLYTLLVIGYLIIVAYNIMVATLIHKKIRKQDLPENLRMDRKLTVRVILLTIFYVSMIAMFGVLIVPTSSPSFRFGRIYFFSCISLIISASQVYWFGSPITDELIEKPELDMDRTDRSMRGSIVSRV